MGSLSIRRAVQNDLEAIRKIYNQGIEDRIATLETELKDISYMQKWFEERTERYSVLVAEMNEQFVGWASLNPYSHRCAYKGVADLSIYIHRDFRGKGAGSALLQELERIAVSNHFYKIVLFTFPTNQLGQGLYRKNGYREVGIFQNHGIVDGQFVDVMAMEKLLNK